MTSFASACSEKIYSTHESKHSADVDVPLLRIILRLLVGRNWTLDGCGADELGLGALNDELAFFSGNLFGIGSTVADDSALHSSARITIRSCLSCSIASLLCWLLNLCL